MLIVQFEPNWTIFPNISIDDFGNFANLAFLAQLSPLAILAQLYPTLIVLAQFLMILAIGTLAQLGPLGTFCRSDTILSIFHNLGEFGSIFVYLTGIFHTTWSNLGIFGTI